MKRTRVDSYHKHGCYFTGKLAVIDYAEDVKQHSRYGQFGSMVTADVGEKALRFAREHYPDCELLVDVPGVELVVRIEQ